MLVRRITVENPDDTAILKITATGNSPQAARDLATAWVSGLIATIDANEGVDGAPGTSEMTVSLAESASLPTSPAFPDTKVAMLVGGVLGLGGGIAFALVRAVSDRRIRPTDDVEERLGLPVVGALPESAVLTDRQHLHRGASTPPAGSKAARVDFALRESLRMLRTNLQFMNVDDPPRIIVVSSALPGEGKSTIAASLARTLADASESVVLVDGDLRRPTVADTMGIRGDLGLTDALAGRVQLADVLHQASDTTTLIVLPAGTIPPNPSELLGSERMGTILSDLGKHAIVIVDAPPLLSVTDSAVLTRHADGALLVTSVGKSTYDHVEKAITAVERIHGKVLGIVLNHMPAVGTMDTYEYAYDSRKGRAKTSGTPAGSSGGAARERDGSRDAASAGPIRVARRRRTAAPEATTESSGEVTNFEDLLRGATVDVDARRNDARG
ncbi:polysaccharide biosynthesis tyrosine autokinase [Microbacterium sp. Mu-80]|uniref:Polysaccharide biosynthesis tyrosine autokinase n=1 Tax=Microbacterium bandirmense TaxID=3122050 RepID=A0ABU8LCE2_9MICO